MERDATASANAGLITALVAIDVCLRKAGRIRCVLLLGVISSAGMNTNTSLGFKLLHIA